MALSDLWWTLSAIVFGSSGRGERYFSIICDMWIHQLISLIFVVVFLKRD